MTNVPTEEKPLSARERADALMASFTHRLNTNTPRTEAELNELRAVFALFEQKELG